jgi:CubicO group peptidase (beta-lactamase class C family)
MDALERQQCLFRNRTGRRPVRPHLRRGAVFLGSALFLIAGLAPGDAEVGPSLNLSTAITPIIARDLAAGHVPGAVVLVSREGQTVFRQAFGLRALEPAPARLETDDIFDLASLTKVIATTTAVMQLVEQGRIQLDAPASVYWPAFAANGKEAITVRQLLTHTSGLAPDLDLSAQWHGQDDGLARAATARAVRAPGTAFLYSDINFIVLGEIVARVSGEPLDAYVQAHVFKPLGMTSTGFHPPASRLDHIVATDREQGHLRWGEVQDPTAYRMGGVAGHAGLFSTADDLARFAAMLVNGGTLDGARILKPETVALMTRPQALPGGIRRGLGWDMGSAYALGLDQWFGPASFGHTGYTGCLMWIDPATQSYLIVLTSRLHPDGAGDVKALRQDLGRVVGSLIRSRT